MAQGSERGGGVSAGRKGRAARSNRRDGRGCGQLLAVFFLHRSVVSGGCNGLSSGAVMLESPDIASIP